MAGGQAEPNPLFIFGLFQETTPMAPLLERLREIDPAGPPPEISSALPVMAEPVGVGWKRIKLYHVTLIAGVMGLLFGVLLAGGTAALYPLPTGGKPIVSAPIVGIVAFETMMLSAIVTTFLTMLVKIVRLGWGKRRYDTRIDEGFIGVSVRVEPEGPKEASVRELFREFGAVEVEIQ